MYLLTYKDSKNFIEMEWTNLIKLHINSVVKVDINDYWLVWNFIQSYIFELSNSLYLALIYNEKEGG